MSEHKLSLGQSLIDGIFELGQMLGYFVEKEFPVDLPTYGEAPAVDVAWFSKKGNRFPLFIFEVESRATNGMTNNPLKVYAQENREFEKPLFFFHLVAQGGSNSSRPRNLESLYGKNNYRIYLMGSSDTVSFLCDVLEQHVRVKEDINYINLWELLSSEPWVNKVDRVKVLLCAAELGLSKFEIIPSFVRIARSNQELIPSVIDLFYAKSTRFFENTEFDTYLGQQWFYPIICSMMVGISTDSEEKERWSEHLLTWQDSYSDMPMITPAFGLSCDYDDFILGCAPQLITAIIVLSHSKDSHIKAFVPILVEILSKTGVCWHGLNSAIYLLHISARLNMVSEFNVAVSYLTDNTPISVNNIYSPPSMISASEGEFSFYFQQSKKHHIPFLSDFIAKNESLHAGKTPDLQAIALRALDDNNYIYEWSDDLLDALWATNC